MDRDGVILVTGGTGALGAAVVEELLGDGRRVASTWIDEGERDRLSEQLGDRDGLTLVEADLRSDEGAERAVATATGEGGILAGVACLVGGCAADGRLDEADAEQPGRLLELNLGTAQRTCRAAIPRLASPGGAIVLVGARAALDPFPGGAAYATAKGAVLAFSRALAADLRAEGIRVNAIVPDAIDTPANRESMPDADHGAWPKPAEIAPVVRFLLSPDSAVVSGATVPVFGI